MCQKSVAGATVVLKIGGSRSRDETTDKRPSAKKHHGTTQSADDSQNRTIASGSQESISSLLVNKLKFSTQSLQQLLTGIASWVKS